MTLDEIKSLRKRIHDAEEIQREITRLKERIGCIERTFGGFTFDCGGKGIPLGDSEGLRAVILGELKRQVEVQEARFEVL